MNELIPFIIGFLLGGILIVPFLFKKDCKNKKENNKQEEKKKSKVNIKIIYDHVKKLYFVYYNRHCMKVFDNIEQAKSWSENNIENFLKGNEVKYEKDINSLE